MSLHRGTRVLVTGAGRGIGRSCALSFMREGADVILTDVAFREQFSRNAGEGKCAALECDVTDYDAVELMVSRAVKEMGGIDILVSSAVYSDRGPFEERDPTLIKRTLDVSLLGAMNVMRAALPALKCSHATTGRISTILLISSPHAEIAFGNCEAYNAAKAGVQHAAFSIMSANIGSIRSIAIHPGFTRTPGEEAFTDVTKFDTIAAGLPQRRMIEPEEVGDLAVKICDPALSLLWGVIRFDGGLGLPHWAHRTNDSF